MPGSATGTATPVVAAVAVVDYERLKPKDAQPLGEREERGWFRDDDLSTATVEQFLRAASHFGRLACGDEIRPLIDAARICR